MMRTLIAALLLAGLAPPALRAQPGLLEVEIESVDPKRFPILEMQAVVVDRAGLTLRGLTERNLALWEDEELLKLDSVTLSKDPVSVVFALDSSGTMIPSADRLRKVAGDMLRLLDPRDAAAVLEFSSEARFLVRFGETRERALRALNALVPYGPTALYDAAYRALLELAQRPGKRNVIVISDGKDQNKTDSGPGSRHTRQEVLDLAKRLEIPVHGIAVGKNAMKKEIAFLARETGGRAFYAPRAIHLEDLYRRLIAHLKGRITLRARTKKPELDATERELVLRVRAGEGFGESNAFYSAPGRWVVDVGPVGFQNKRRLSTRTRAVAVRDAALQELSPGDGDSLREFFGPYFSAAPPRSVAPGL